MQNSSPASMQRLLWMVIRSSTELFGDTYFEDMFGRSLQNLGLSTMKSRGEIDPCLPFNLMGIQKILAKHHGAQSTQGILNRLGRATFSQYLTEYAEPLGWMKLDFKLLPTRKRIETGLEILSSSLYGNEEGKIQVLNCDNAWIWQDQNCPWCLDRSDQHISCQFTAGFLQEFCCWAGNGKTYRVQEVECMGSGGKACIYQIEKIPLD